MARKRGDGPKSAEFERLLSDGVEPLEAARRAGYTRPARQLVKRDKWAAEEGTKPVAGESDANLAKRTLRNVARLATTDAPRVQAAKALLEQRDVSDSSQSQTVVVLRGRDPAPNAKGQWVSTDIDPSVLAAAIEHVRARREASDDG
ncbi:MAG: hypothetical protein RL701_2150 [Pseudomonadota bacterium]|jgi:hypothetical protein